MYKQLEVPVMAEPPGLVWGTKKRPVDVLVLVPVGACPGAGRTVALDVGITDAGTADGVEHGTWRIPEGALRRAVRVICEAQGDQLREGEGDQPSSRIRLQANCI